MISSLTMHAAAAAFLLGASASAQQFQHQVGLIPGTPRWTEGVECADVDNDGDLDVFFADGEGFSSAGTQRQNVLLINQFIPSGTLSFSDESVTRLGVHLSNAKGVVARDVNADGWVDVLFCNAFATDPPFLYINQGLSNPGYFTEEAATRGLTLSLGSGSAQFGDLDDDGDPDLILNDGYLGSGSDRPRVYVNNGLGVFTDTPAWIAAASTKSAQMDVQLIDLDLDWDLDFFGACRAANGGTNHYLMQNDAAGTLTNFAITVPSNSGSTYEAEVGDLDGDNDIDLFMVSSTGFAEGAVRNNLVPSASFTLTQLATLADGNDDNEVALFDWDVDGDYDVMVGSLSGTREAMWRNDGALTFANVSAATITAVSDPTLDCTVADLDNDGRYDLVTAQGESNSPQWANKVYKNTGAIDTRAPIVVAVDAPASGPSIGPTKVRAKVRDQVMDDGVDYVSAQARYVVRTTLSTQPVSIQAGGFTPSVLNVSAGTKVVWTNSSGANQSVVSTTTPFTYDSGTLANGQQYEHFFVQPGTYNYTSVPSGFTAQVVVGGSASTIASTYSGGAMHRSSMPDTAAGAGVQLVYELVFTDWPGNVRVTDASAITLTPSCAAPSTYCTAKINSLFCLPAIGSSGTPSASAGSGFNVTASNILNNKSGLLFYGLNGQIATAFQGGYLCVKSPTVRTAVQSSGGSVSGSDCTGTFTYDFNARIASGADTSLVQGAVVEGQFWSRDPADPFTTNMTNALHFTICP